jgi:hypothetical protein
MFFAKALKTKALQKARESSQIADNKRVELRSRLLVPGAKPLRTDGRGYLGTLGKWTG